MQLMHPTLHSPVRNNEEDDDDDDGVGTLWAGKQAGNFWTN